MSDRILFKKLKRKSRENKNEWFLSVKFIDLLNKAERKKYVKHLKRNIITAHCKGHDTIILLFDFNHFDAVHRRLLSKKNFVDS